MCLTNLTLLRETKGGERENKGKRRGRVKQVESEENPGGGGGGGGGGRGGTRHTFHFKAFFSTSGEVF